MWGAEVWRRWGVVGGGVGGGGGVEGGWGFSTCCRGKMTSAKVCSHLKIS